MTDVLVVGGGPAGVLAAYSASKLNRSVIIIDTKEKVDIGQKTCGDAINLFPVEALRKEIGLALPHDKELAEPVDTMVFKTPRVEMSLIAEGFVVNRHIYGQRLLSMTETAGVEIRDRVQALSAIVSEGKVIGAKVKDRRTGNITEIHAKVTIDCSGRHSVLRKSLDPQEFPLLENKTAKCDLVTSYREIINLNEDQPPHPYSRKLYIIYHEELPEPGYFWVFPKGERRLNVGIGYFMDIPRKKPIKRLFHEILHKYYYSPDKYTVDAKDAKGATVPTRHPIMNAVANGFLVAGDAACHVNPLTAEGHGPALVAGYNAGKVAVEAINAGDITESGLWHYNHLIMKNGIYVFGPQYTKTQLVTDAIRHIKTRGLEFLIKRRIVTQDEFFEMNEGKSSGIGSLIGKVIRMFPRYGLLFYLYRLTKIAAEIDDLILEYPNSPDEYLNWYERFQKVLSKSRRK